ncbi:MAG TPA: exonuclease SbcCD subunit D [Candidatus Thermoplasmatota archaeon]|nr:exonuclease SbcCD subunit D [Candidatus Thermoplasmatota archaeon]
MVKFGRAHGGSDALKLLHVSDTHVGFSAYHRVTPEGLNQREADFFDAFSRAIDAAIERRVDLVLHSGDLFDSVRPTNRAISHVLHEARRLHDARIPLVVISGNHEAPRLRETGAVLRLLDFMPGVHAVYKGRTEVVRVGDLAVHATPHAPSQEALVAELRGVRPLPDARWNVATLHAGVLGVGDFRTGEFNEQVVPQNELPQGMDYVALGHYHRRTEVAPGVWYAGSTERCTFRECGEEKGANLVDLARGKVEFVPLPARPMVDLPALACHGLPDGDVAPAVLARIGAAALDGAVARLKVGGLRPHVYATLDMGKVRQAAAAALHFALDVELLRDEAAPAAHEALGSLADEFEAFLEARPVPEQRDKVLALGQALLRAAEGA